MVFHELIYNLPGFIFAMNAELQSKQIKG